MRRRATASSDYRQTRLEIRSLTMTNDERASHIRRLLWEQAHPTLRRMDHDRITKLAEQILQVATSCGLWSKWTPDREAIAERAADVWVPMGELRDSLNDLPGPQLTKVDVEQRIRALREQPYRNYPTPELEAEAYVVFAEEKARGTEFIAILGYLEDWQLGSEERLRQKAEKERRERVAREKQHAETRLRNGADCPWTVATGVATCTVARMAVFTDFAPSRTSVSMSRRLRCSVSIIWMSNVAGRLGGTAREVKLLKQSQKSPGTNMICRTTDHAPPTVAAGVPAKHPNTAKTPYRSSGRTRSPG